MAYQVQKVSYRHLTVPARAGQAAKILEALKDAGADLLAFSGFPTGGGKAQLDLVTQDRAPVNRVARQQGWRLSKVKRGFLVQGAERLARWKRCCHGSRDENINITAAQAIAAGKGRYGMIFWVNPKKYTSAARLLKARARFNTR